MFLELFDRSFDRRVAEGSISPATKRNYRLALQRFFKVVQTHPRASEIFPKPLPDRMPSRPSPSLRKRRQSHNPLISNFYYFPLEKFPSELKSDIAIWHQSLLRLSGSPDRKPQPQPFGRSKHLSARERRLERERRRQLARDEGYEFTRPELPKLKRSTLNSYVDAIQRYMGWLVNVEEYSLTEITFSLLSDPTIVADYGTWLIEERGCTPGEPQKLVQAMLTFVKWKHFPTCRRGDWSDVPLVKTLTDLCRKYIREYRATKPARDSEKWATRNLTHAQTREVVDYLWQCCAPRKACGSKRPFFTQGFAFQVHLLVKFLTYAPVRQEELRKLIYGDTLLRVTDSDGIERYAVRLLEHKRSSTVQRPRYYPLPQILTPDLDRWIFEWRPKILAATETMETWLAGRGYSLKQHDQISCNLELARAGRLPKPVKNLEKYVFHRSTLLSAIQSRIDAWETVRDNARACKHTFLMMGHRDAKNFGLPYDQELEGYEPGCRSHLSGIVARHVASATLALFGKEYPLSPHNFRHIGARQVRIAEASVDAFSALVGHSPQTNQMYANQVTLEYDLIGDNVDNWWV
ncbi:hypothetical protein [Baaleninema simplex]|uniref:hypothetical protein n=1 Tax=Baaleninema simplex TaxID=2862350 RepID=UPI0011819DE1|nr:hypothetical protein [Baaleninema simplex]